jgi:hypothetical protein
MSEFFKVGFIEIYFQIDWSVMPAWANDDMCELMENYISDKLYEKFPKVQQVSFYDVYGMGVMVEVSKPLQQLYDELHVGVHLIISDWFVRNAQ